ncbi:hypothetical protein EV360DRAFT_90540 [Lentinula raphanica]|nr:hypothetical protein EV360DRAFT_90540 [Lentinula raphanica]
MPTPRSHFRSPLSSQYPVPAPLLRAHPSPDVSTSFLPIPFFRSTVVRLAFVILGLLLPRLITSDDEDASASFLGIETPFYTQLLLSPARIQVIRPLDISSNLPTDP